jgi:hypothetical protein
MSAAVWAGMAVLAVAGVAFSLSRWRHRRRSHRGAVPAAGLLPRADPLVLPPLGGGSARGGGIPSVSRARRLGLRATALRSGEGRIASLLRCRLSGA